MSGRPLTTNVRVLLRPAEDDEWPGDSERLLSWAHHPTLHLWRPPIDVFETDEALTVVVEIAGIRVDDFSIALGKQSLTISGVRAGSTGPRAYHQMEILHGEFVAEVALPFPIDSPGAEATYTDGFLTVRLPKLKARRITVSG